MEKIIFALAVIALNISLYFLLGLTENQNVQKKKVLAVLALTLLIVLVLLWSQPARYFAAVNGSFALFAFLGLRYVVYNFFLSRPQIQDGSKSMPWILFNPYVPAIFVMFVIISQCLTLFVWDK